MDSFLQQFGSVAWTIFTILLICAAVAGIGLLLITRSIRRLRVPREADFATTMRMIPLSLVVLLDLLDLGLDVFSAPIIWVVLNHMGLPNLRNKATIEALIPITGPIPTFTICWFAARLLNLGAPWYYAEERRPRARDYARLRDERMYNERPRRPVTIIDMEDE